MNSIIEKLVRYFVSLEIGIYSEAKAQLWTVEAQVKNIPYLKAENAGGSHIFIRPRRDREPFFILADDLDADRIERDHKTPNGWKPGRLIVESSPGNFQAWIKSDRRLTESDKFYWLRRLGSDPAAAPAGRWGRCPGFRNRKPQHETAQGFPLAKLIWCDWATMASIPQGDKCADRRGSLSLYPTEGGLCHQEISRDQYRGKSESETDFRFALALLRRGVKPEEVAARIEQERPGWEHHPARADYLARTIRKAQAIIREG